MSKYKDINTSQEYDQIPEGKVQPIIVNGQPVTEEAYNKYYNSHPIELEEVIISPKQNKSTTIAAYYDRIADVSPDNYIRHINQSYSDNQIRRANYWEGIPNLFSLSQYIGAAIDYAQGEKPFWNGVWYGNSGYLPDNFAIENPRLTAVLNSLGDIGLTYGLAKTYQWGTTPRFKYGTETPIVEYTYFSPRVKKYSQVTPTEMHIRNNTKGFVRSDYKGKDPSTGLYIYIQPKIWFPNNPRLAFNRAISKTLKQGYEKITHPNLQGIALMNKRLNRIISDFGINGQGQVGWTWNGAGFGDAAFETILEFMIAMEKKGGKLK